MEKIGKVTTTSTFSGLPKSSEEHNRDESVQKTTSVLEEKLTGVVDAHVQVFLVIQAIAWLTSCYMVLRYMQCSVLDRQWTSH